ncbi:nuclear transport factor 2 family protein [Sulfitobacter sabulilitoris]|uniref:Nuclear transport factor 2 family protein n=1 Tax=Sulfitobacter sabulilitoris TaxID=2562655 RepID=A0A5S3P7U0_9RHOB|nr:nuclear transport factor 2 family protein [Sulfitobacter sabulilitoris]TMM49472.1 nuclear transport factor 2 family protein [Sulfitobacter sabulilitoris]
MKNFDPRWKDFPDYIIGITKEIWEDRGIATLDHYYGADLPVRSPGSIVVGNKNVVAATMSTLAEFPDRTLFGEDVIWCEGNDDGLLSSHRLLSTATHTNPGVYGAATGKTVRYRIIADCYARANQITDEWLVRDQGAIVRQMGWTPADYARDLIDREGGPDACVKPFLPENDVAGPYTGRGNDSDWGAKYADILMRIMAADFTVIPREYDRAVIGEYAGGVTAISHRAVDDFWIGLRASFPSATFKIHHVVGRDDAMMSPRAAIRWSLDGLNDGWGAFGRPTGKRVHIMGMSHAEFGPWGLRREYTLYDETAVWKQIHLQTG